MLRQLPPTITADETPDWLPVGWIVHSTVLKRGRQTKTYTNLRTRAKRFTKDQVLEYDQMYKNKEVRESAIAKRKARLKAFEDKDAAREWPSWLPDGWKAELRIGSFCRDPLYTVCDNMSSGLKTHSEQEVFHYQNTKESEAASSGEIDETGSDYITYVYNSDEEDLSDDELVEDKDSLENVENSSKVTSTTTPLRLQPQRMKKMESRAITQCLLEDEDMSSDNEENVLEVEKENRLGEAGVVSHSVESFQEENLHYVVVDKAREIPGLTGSFSIEINLNCEPEIVDLTQESGDKNEEPLEGQATQEETANESRRSIFFPHIEAPSHSVLFFDNSDARPSANDLVNTIELGLNPCAVEWPEPCPNFPFEPLTTSVRTEDDDSVIRRYLEQYFTAAGSADSNLPLPDFGLPSFSNIFVSLVAGPWLLLCNRQFQETKETSTSSLA